MLPRKALGNNHHMASLWHPNQNLYWKLRQQSAICWNSLGLFRDYSLNCIFSGVELFCFSRQKTETFSICLEKNFVKPHKISSHSAYSDNFYFHFFYPFYDWVEILWGFTKFIFKQMLKISAFYLEKQKSFIPKIIYAVV
jgi:hypothetical protein